MNEDRKTVVVPATVYDTIVAVFGWLEACPLADPPESLIERAWEENAQLLEDAGVEGMSGAWWQEQGDDSWYASRMLTGDAPTEDVKIARGD